MRLPLNALQKAAYERASADLPVALYDEGAVPEGADFPYATIGAMTFSRAPLKVTSLVSATVTFHVFSAGIGKKEINDLLDRLVASLSRAPLELEDDFADGFGGTWELAESFPEPHESLGVVQHGTLRYRWDITDQKQ